MAKPPFAVLPDPASVFSRRATRLEAMAGVIHPLAPYLGFLAAITRAQHDILPGLPPPALPPADRIRQALDHGMPPLSRTIYQPDAIVDATMDGLTARLVGAEMPAMTAAALEVLRAVTRDERRAMITAVLEDAAPSDGAVAQQALIAAGLQVHFTRLAALLTAGDLKPVADSACPVCGSGVMTSAIVGWPSAHNTRFCTCSLCATMWHVVRVRCLLCGSTDGISYRSIEGDTGSVKAETCGKCKGYVKVLYEVDDSSIEPLADDVATLGLDMLLGEEGWKRGGQNPFLAGY